MVEHRLIEKVLKIVQLRMSPNNPGAYDPLFVDSIVDFVRTYADRTHHGKEEDILFLRLASKSMDADDARIMAELVHEHTQARAKVGELVALNDADKKGDTEVIGRIYGIMDWLTAFYPKHIDKEDNVFFPDTERYFSPEELEAMLKDFWEFDRKMIHEKYERFYKSLL